MWHSATVNLLMPPQAPSFAEAFRFWLKLGFISFGGPAGQIAIMHTYLVEQKRWISDSRFMHALNYCMVLPGPEAQQLATYIGWLLHGVRGGLAAGILFVLPSAFILWALSWIYVSFGALPWVAAMFYGLKPAVIAIVLLALVKIGKKSLLTPIHWMVATASFVGMYLLNVPFPLILLAALVVAALALRFFPRWFNHSITDGSKQVAEESDYYLNKNTIIPGLGFRWQRLVVQLALATVLWMVPLLVLVSASDALFWKKLVLFFSQAAVVTFGGAYAVLPYVAQESVEKWHWLTSMQMLDGLALGETTPGPLIMVLAFVGYMAGYNHFGQSAAMGAIGLFTTTYYTFLPCFLFIFLGAPIIEKTQENKTVKHLLGVVTAAVVGVMFNLTIYLGKAVVFPNGAGVPDVAAVVWTLISVLMLYRFKISLMLWIGLSAIFGLFRYLLFL